MAGAAKCPECGAPVSAFAAGCAKCGADLEAHHRRQRLAAASGGGGAGRRGLPRPDLTRIPLTRFEALYLAVTLFAVIWISVLGIVLGALGVMHGVYEGRRGWAIVCGVLAAAALGLELSRL